MKYKSNYWKKENYLEYDKKWYDSLIERKITLKKMTAYNSMSSIPDLISSSVSLDLGKNDKFWLNQKYMSLVNVRKIVERRSYYI